MDASRRGKEKEMKSIKHILISYIIFITLFTFSFLLNSLFMYDFSDNLNSWLQANKSLIQLSNESLCFSTFSLSIFLIFCITNPIFKNNIKYLVIFALLLLCIPILLFTMIVQGRLVYQINSLVLIESNIALLVSFYFGSQHILFLIIGSIVLILSFKKKNNILSNIMSIAIGLLLIIEAYPYLLNKYINVSIIIIFAIWNIRFIIASFNRINNKEHPTKAST